MYGLPGLLCTIDQKGTAGDIVLETAAESNAEASVNIYGPQGLRRFIRLALALSRTHMKYTYAVHELILRDEHRPVGWTEWAALDADPTHDPPLHCERSGRDIHAAADDGPLMGELKQDKSPDFVDLLSQGRSVLVNDQVILPDQVLMPPVRGHRIAIMGDSYDSRELERLVSSLCEQKLITGHILDVLVHEATLEQGLAEDARLKGHSTPVEVTQLAARLHVRLLILTHFSQRYAAVDNSEMACDPGFWYNVTNADNGEPLVHSMALQHTIPSVGWLVLKPEGPRSLCVNTARSLGVPDGPLMGELKQDKSPDFVDLLSQGRSVLVNDQVILPDQVLMPPVRGHRIAIMGDSYDSRELERLVSSLCEQKLITGHILDVLVHEATLEQGLAEDARLKGHSTPVEVTQLAARLHVRLLILTHFSQRYAAVDNSEMACDPAKDTPVSTTANKLMRKQQPSVKILLDQARSVGFDGDVILADDLVLIRIPPVPKT
ncbi:hypothetical protein AHF37_05967 [Paragonimus kellicotti]|nr:hypothetical protein AHF37_05967 [Paragonimus kellicotti]